jgi:hypothetical protein
LIFAPFLSFGCALLFITAWQLLWVDQEAHRVGGKRHIIKTREALQLWFQAVEGSLAVKELAIKRRTLKGTEEKVFFC